MTLSEWIEQYCEDNGIELPSGVPDEKTALQFLSVNGSGGGGERVLKVVNITWVDLPETFDNYVSIIGYIEIKTADGYEESDLNSTQCFIIQWDDEWSSAEKIIAYSSKAEIGDNALVIPQNYLPNYKIIVKSGDADDSNSTWLEVYGDCTLSLEAVE